MSEQKRAEMQMREIVYFSVRGFELFVGVTDWSSRLDRIESGRGFMWKRLYVCWDSPWSRAER